MADGMTLADLMTRPVTTTDHAAVIATAAQKMRDDDIGDVIVLGDDGKPCGVITDRDIVVRAVAQGMDPHAATIGEICSDSLVRARPDTTADQAIQMMREHAIRRLAVCDDDDRLVGVVSLGDLAVERDPSSLLAEISAAEPND